MTEHRARNLTDRRDFRVGNDTRAGRRTSERFWEKVNKTPTCWLWMASLSDGYGQFWRGDRNVPAHVWTWEEEFGPVPDGLELDHLCRVRACVRPDHLEPVTPRTNNLRSDSPAGVNARRTECVNGHALDVENTYRRPDGSRDCRECKKIRQRIYDRTRRGPPR